MVNEVPEFVQVVLVVGNDGEGLGLTVQRISQSNSGVGFGKAVSESVRG